jgi:hypothetical protein
MANQQLITEYADHFFKKISAHRVTSKQYYRVDTYHSSTSALQYQTVMKRNYYGKPT